jgi:hypothetical protein
MPLSWGYDAMTQMTHFPAVYPCPGKCLYAITHFQLLTRNPDNLCPLNPLYAGLLSVQDQTHGLLVLGRLNPEKRVICVIVSRAPEI